MDDPVSNCFIMNPFVPEDDPNITVEVYERSEEQNEELGILDMEVDPEKYTKTGKWLIINYGASQVEVDAQWADQVEQINFCQVYFELVCTWQLCGQPDCICCCSKQQKVDCHEE